MPQQPNGYDCGVYTIKYVEHLLCAWPRSRPADMAESFITQLPRKMFTQDDVDAERVKLLSLLAG